MQFDQRTQAGFQQQRPEAERNMPDYVRDELARQRALDVQRRKENPELYAKLDLIEVKLDKLLALMTR